MADKADYSEGRARYKAFMLLTLCLAIILVGNTVCLWFGKIQPDLYDKVLLTLGVPTLLGMAFHAFFNENQTGGKDVKKINPGVGVPVDAPVDSKG